MVNRPGAAEPVRLNIVPNRNEVTGAWYIMALSVTNVTGAAAVRLRPSEAVKAARVW